MQNKHVIRFLFFCIFLSLIVNVILYRQFVMHDIILRQISENNKHLVERYKKQIWSSSNKIVKKLHSSDNNISSSHNLLSFIQDTSLFFEDTDTIKVQIFNKNGKEFFATNNITISVIDKDTSSLYEYLSTKLDYFTLKDFVIYDGLSQSYQGTQVNSVFPKVSITSTDHNSHNASVVVNYIPLINSLGNIEAVFVLYTDATELRMQLGLLERKVLGVFVLVFILFFGIIIHNTSYAQKVIDKQLQINKYLEEARIHAEDENRSKTEFLANVSHELRTPLNAIIGFSEIILSEHSANIDPKKYNDYVSDILHSGKHLLSVINDLLDYSKASADKLRVEIIEIDLNKMIQSSMRMIEQRAAVAGIKLITELPANHIIIKADSKRLKQALLNLLSNSVKFTLEGGSITVNVTKNSIKQLVYIRIIDTGIGIAEHDISKALSSFGQVDNSLSRKYEGTGLGLPLTRKLVELMNGKLEIASAVGVGTTITLTFEYDQNNVL